MEGLQYHIERCVRCGFCNSICPTSQITHFESHKARGRIVLLQASFEGVTNIDLKRYYELASLCLNCKQCLLICPAGIPIPQIMRRVKEAYHIMGKPKILHFLSNNVPLLCKLGSAMGQLQRLPLSRNLLSIIQQIAGFDKRRPLPFFQRDNLLSFSRLLGNKAKRHAVFFAGCHSRWVEPYVGHATADLLASLGVEVITPKQECCGFPLLCDGLISLAINTIKRNSLIVAKYIKKGFEVVTSCPTCSLTLKQEAKEYCNDVNTQLVAEHTYELGEYVYEVLKSTPVVKVSNYPKLKIIYHQPCHLKSQSINSYLWEGMHTILNLELIQPDEDTCCGMAGMFGRKNYEVSLKVGVQLFKQISQAKPDLVVTECPACREQISYVTGIKSVHPVIFFYPFFGKKRDSYLHDNM